MLKALEKGGSDTIRRGGPRALDDVDDDALIAAAQQLRRRMRAAPDQVLYLEGEPASDYYVVQRGIVRLCRQLGDGRRQIAGFVFPGGVFGIDGAGAYVGSAEAVTRLDYLRVPRRELAALHPRLSALLLTRVCEELAGAQAQLLLLGRKTPEERLASFILAMAERVTAEAAPAVQFALPMRRRDISDYLGLTSETVSRTFTNLRRRGLITLRGPQQVTILAPRRLRSLATGDERSAA